MDKIFLAEISDSILGKEWFPYQSFVYYLDGTNLYTGISSDFEPEKLNHDFIFTYVISVVIKGGVLTSLISVTSITDVAATQGSFYFDTSTFKLYVHFPNSKPPKYFLKNSISIGVGITLSKHNSEWDEILNNNQYKNYLTSFPSFTYKKDDLFFGKQVFNNTSISFTNFDYFLSSKLLGQFSTNFNGNIVRLLSFVGKISDGVSYSDFDLIYQGYVKSVSEGLNITFKLEDIRRSLDKLIANRVIDSSDFADIDDGTTIPEIYGKTFNIPLVCLNKNVKDGGSSIAYRFMICDSLKHDISSSSITNIKVDGVNISPSVTITEDTTHGFYYIDISSSFFKVSDGSSTRFTGMDKVTCDCEGYQVSSTLVASGMEIIRLVLLRLCVR